MCASLASNCWKPDRFRIVLAGRAVIDRAPLEIAATIPAATAFIVKMCRVSIVAAHVINEVTYL